MFEFIFYQDENGKQPIAEFLQEIDEQTGKEGRVRRSKVYAYLKLLRESGTRLGSPYVKHIDGDIWELRPLRDRVFFVVFREDKIVLLHQFMKRTQKTPRREIEKAKREYKDFLRRLR